MTSEPAPSDSSAVPGDELDAPPPSGGGTLGTFLGVFTPTMLTILGVIMYLRLGWVVGNVGLVGTLVIVALAHAITIITTLAFSAVATNGRVGVGGAYFIISRSLGLEVGGAIGLPLFLSQTLSVTLYSFGLAESLAIVWPGVPVQPAAAVIIVLVGALAMRGADLALKIQVPLMALIGLSILALVAGVIFRDPVTVPPSDVDVAKVGFWVAFAVFFPAVTGIMAGLGLSGDLKDASKSLPRGSLAAVLAGFAVYLALPYLLSTGASPEALRTDEMIWTRIAPLGAILILPGLWGAILSSAVGSILGAPRTLQALSLDRLAPAWLGRSAKSGDEPIAGAVVTVALALLAVLLGDLNAVAEVVSMFFLTVYGTINLVAALETLSGDPSWRPRLAVPWPITLLGALACVAVMFLINPLASVLAILIELGLLLLLRRRERSADWGDVRRGAYEALVRWCLVRLTNRQMSARNWRPHVLVFVDDIAQRLMLVRFAVWFSQGRGVVTVCELVVGELAEQAERRSSRRDRMAEILRAERLGAFPEVDIVNEVISGVVDVAQANGIGGFDSNTVLMGLPSGTERLAKILQVARRLEHLHKSTLIGRVRANVRPPVRRRERIDVWWGGRERNGDLMLLLAHLMGRNPRWRRARIRLLSIRPASEDLRTARKTLQDIIADTRIVATAVTLPFPTEGTVSAAIQDESKDAAVVFLGLRVPEVGAELEYARRLLEMVAPFENVFLVKNSSLFRGELI